MENNQGTSKHRLSISLANAPLILGVIGMMLAVFYFALFGFHADPENPTFFIYSLICFMVALLGVGLGEYGLKLKKKRISILAIIICVITLLWEIFIGGLLLLVAMAFGG